MLVLDVDIYPFPSSLAADLARVIGSGAHPLGMRHVYVLPVFEFEGRLEQLGNLTAFGKVQLRQLELQGRVEPFYFRLCPHCHTPTQYNRWWFSSGWHPHRVDYYDPWEPFFVAENAIVPAYDERFKQCLWLENNIKKKIIIIRSIEN